VIDELKMGAVATLDQNLTQTVIFLSTSRFQADFRGCREWLMRQGHGPSGVLQSQFLRVVVSSPEESDENTTLKHGIWSFDAILENITLP
jgi:hypothetical protein